MAHRLYDGFDHYATADMAGKWTSVTSATIQGGTVRNGAGALQGTETMDVRFTNPAGAQANGIAGFGFRVSTPGASVRPILFALDGASTQLDLVINTDNTFSLRRAGTTVLATSNDPLIINTWYWIEAKWTIHNSTGRFELRVNNATLGWINFTGDTQDTVNASFTGYRLSGRENNAWFDDLYFGDGSSDFVGVSKIVSAIASAGNGTHINWTPLSGTDHGAMVDETPPDGDTSYNSSLVATHRDSYNFPALGVTTLVHGLQLNHWVKKSQPDPRYVNGFARISSIDYDGATNTPLSDSAYSDARQIWEASPASAVAWSPAEIDAAEFGIRVQA